MTVKYALLAYNPSTADQRDPIPADIAAALERPEVQSWVRLQPAESATTISSREGRTLLTDGPFVDSKEYLGGVIVIEAANLDEALEIAAEFQSLMRRFGTLEVRPILEVG
jgi:hypothetical protein